YERIATETLDYVLREMTGEHGAFYSSQDADSEGEEGKFFVWTLEELEATLGEEDAERAAAYWGVSKTGNFEHGRSALHRLHKLDKHGHEAAFEELPDDIIELRERLFEARDERVHPSTDTKVLAAWNGLMIGALAKAGFALDEPRFVEAADEAADFILAEMMEGELDGDFQLMRTFKEGRARFPGYLDDFAFLAAGLLDLFEATGRPERLTQAEALVDRMVELFWDEEEGAFYFSAEHHGDLIVRQKEGHDGAVPAGNSIAIMDLLRVAELRSRPELAERADDALRLFYRRMRRAPQSMSEMLQALDFHAEGPAQIVLVEPAGADTEPMRNVLRTTYVPNQVDLLVDLDRIELEAWAELSPLVEGRTPRDDKPTAYVCFEGACQQPTTDPDEFRQLLG
ncbi:MAG: thioredoxin domain-containing protein, partial [Persicimonas sp.]